MLRALALIAALCVFLCSLMLLWGAVTFKQPNLFTTNQFFVLEKGMGVRELASELTAQKFISHPLPFLMFAVITGDYKKLQAGEYEVAAGEPMAALLYKMAHGKGHKRSATIPEGKKAVGNFPIFDSTP